MYLINWNMVTGIIKDYYVLRMGEKNAKTAIKSPKIELFNIAGRTMKGWVMVKENALSDDDLGIWLGKAKEFVETLPAK